MSWLRLWHEMPTDPKWRVIAKRSGRPISEVISVFVLMLVNAGASANERGVNGPVQRGRITSWNDEDAGAALDIDADAVRAIRDAMQGRVLDGDLLTGWESRQPKREDHSTDRVRKYREQKGRDATQGNARKGSETQCNATKRDVTHRNARQTDQKHRQKDNQTDLPKPLLKSMKKPSAGGIEKLCKYAEGLGLPVAEMLATAERQQAKNPSAYMTTLAVDHLRNIVPRIPEQTVRDALWGNNKALEALTREIYAVCGPDGLSAYFAANPSMKSARQ